MNPETPMTVRIPGNNNARPAKVEDPAEHASPRRAGAGGMFAIATIACRRGIIPAMVEERTRRANPFSAGPRVIPAKTGIPGGTDQL